MNPLQTITSRIYSRKKLAETVNSWKEQGSTIVFTNGCFDLLHQGHIDYLAKAASLGQKFIVALNSDSSVSKLKGSNRPLQPQSSRALIMAALSFVDAVVVFDEDTPENLMELLNPNIIVKGGDYSIEEVAGAKGIMKNGGSVVLLPFLEGFSTTAIENKIRNTSSNTP